MGADATRATPPLEFCARIPVLDLAEGVVRDYLVAPQDSFVDFSRHPRPKPGSVMWAKEDRLKIGRGLLDRGLVIPLK